MKKIVVTGATSMIGTALIEVAIRENTEVYAIIRPNTSRMNRLIDSPLVHIIYNAIEDLKEIDSIPGDCDVFYHFAWAGTNKFTRDDPQIHEKNIRYTLDAVDLAARTGCKRFVGAGSQAEYGPVDGLIDDVTRFAPVTAYGIAKYAAGILSRKLCEAKHIEHVWGRIFSVYGPHDNKGTMLDTAIDCFLNGKTAHFSSATQMWNYLFESDAGEMFYRMGHTYVPQGTWMVANPESKPLKEYIHTLMQVYGKEAKGEFSKPSDVMPYGLNVNMQKTLKVLRFVPQVSFIQGISIMIQAKKKNYDIL